MPEKGRIERDKKMDVMESCNGQSLGALSGVRSVWNEPVFQAWVMGGSIEGGADFRGKRSTFSFSCGV